VRIAVAALLLLAAIAPAAWAPCLSRAAWPLRAPRAGIAAWLACSLSAVVSSALAGLLLAMPCAQLSTHPATLRACLSLLRAQYASPAGAIAGVTGGLLAVAVVGRVTWFARSAAAAGRRRRATHDDVLAVIARPGPAADVRVIDGDRPTVYCLPGRRRIILTTGALTCLDDGELDAVLAHERAHLAGRHHIVLALAMTLQRAFPAVGFFAVAARQVAYLVEIAADDAAARRAPRLTVASALLTVAAAGVPAGALGASGSATAHRIQRLINPPARDSRARQAVTYLTLATAATLAIAAITLACMTIVHCPPAPLA
jgi:Zn-dependent protease with chaperone function